MENFKAGWYLIYTRPRHEKKVHTRLAELGIHSFLPMKKELSVWHDRKRYIDKPLFPSYVFINVNDMKEYYNGLDADGTLYYVKTGKVPSRINDSIVNSIRLATEKIKDIEVSSDYFQPGRKLIISQGALTGLTCELVQYDSKEKLLVRVDLLKRNVLLSLPEEFLMAVEQTKPELAY
ncbi:MAG: UpxY family transcription antiterminator [Chitinophagaceae bacterium]